MAKKNLNLGLMKSPGFLTPEDEARIFRMTGAELQELMNAMRPGDRWRAVALLYTQYTAKELAKLIGRSEKYVVSCGYRHRDIQQAARVGRNMALTSLAERKALEVLAGLNPANIPDERKARAARDLAEMAEVTHKATDAGAGGKNEDTMELIFSVRRRMTRAAPEQVGAGEGGGEGQVIDAEFEEERGGDKT